ncbi:MAG TPA: hypothetical protein VIN62_02795 [Candidatus Cryosericum sp.]|jgi:hypothetical protein
MAGVSDGKKTDMATVPRARPHARALTVVAILLALVAAGVVTGVRTITASQDVAFYVGKEAVLNEHVSAMMADLPFDATSTYYKSRLELADPSNPKTQYLVAGLRQEAIERIIVMHAQATKAKSLGIALDSTAVDAAVDTYVSEHVASGDTQEEARLRSAPMRSYVELCANAKAYEQFLTSKTVISPDEVRQYYATWSWNYTDSHGRVLTLEEAGQRLVDDALANKKFQMVLSDRAQLLEQTLATVNGDTIYKRFMRRWDSLFGIAIPDSLQPLEVGSPT